MTPTEQMKRIFGPDWPLILDELDERKPVTIAYRQEAEIIGFSYRHDQLCLYLGINGERKTVPLADIEQIEIGEE